MRHVILGVIIVLVALWGGSLLISYLPGYLVVAGAGTALMLAVFGLLKIIEEV